MAINLYKDLPAYADEEKKFINVVVEITKKSQNKYEYDEELGYFTLDRVLHHSMFYPFDYGFIPQTSSDDGDAVDVCLLITNETFPGCVVKSRVIGLLKTSDQDGDDPKIVAVPVSKVDPRRDDIKTIEDLWTHFKEELEIYFKEYKRLEKSKYDKIKIKWFGDIEEAYKIIKEAKETFKQECS